MSQGKIKSIIDSVYPLEKAFEAHTKMLKGKGLWKNHNETKLIIHEHPKTNPILDEGNRLFFKRKVP